MPNKQQTLGQFETPPDVADLLLALCLRREGDRVLDPSCGTGALLARVASWRAWLAGKADANGKGLWGVELEEAAAGVAQEALPHATILHQNFFTLEPAEPFDAIVGNPPYTRAEWIDHLEEQVGEQLAMFEMAQKQTSQGAPRRAGQEKSSLIPNHLWNRGLNRRAGLHAYFFLHGARFLRPGGRFGFVMPNNWLDVGYGAALKQFLLEQFKLLALIESSTERWFEEARVNTCLVVLEKCDEVEARAAHRVRFVQLRQSLTELIRFPPSHTMRFSQVENLISRMLPAEDRTTEAVRARVVRQGNLRAAEKWGVYWRAPAVYRQVRRQAPQRQLVPLRRWATVQRGFTTGANSFFYLNKQTIADWDIETQFRQPLLKSLRNSNGLRLSPAACEQQVLTIPPTANLDGSSAAGYVSWGESKGFHERRTCRQRRPWYVLPLQEPAPIVLPKGIWARHLAPLLDKGILVDQQLYQIRVQPGVPLLAAAALLNSSWLALQMELHGRVNFGEGVLWLASYEVENLLLPDPRYLAADQVEHLAACFTTLAARPLSTKVSDESVRADRQALDQAVFDVLGLSQTEAVVVVDTLLERVAARQTQARSVA